MFNLKKEMKPQRKSRLGLAGPVVRSPAKRQRVTRSAAQKKSPKQQQQQQVQPLEWGSPPRDRSPRYNLEGPQTSSFRGWTEEECRPDMTRTSLLEEDEFEDLNLGFTEPFSVLVTPSKRKRL